MAAKDLYRSELFRRRRLWAEASDVPWWIFSAEYGLVQPDQVIEPYDTRIGRLSPAARAKLADSVVSGLELALGGLSGKVIELHAGDEYTLVVKGALQRRQAAVIRPLEGLRIGEQLGWYGDHLDLDPVTPTEEPKARRPAVTPKALLGDGRGLSRAITDLFVSGDLDLRDRANAPPAGWDGMPEVIAARDVRALGATDAELRLFLTFNAAMDRARDADVLARRAVRLFELERWTYNPQEVVRRSMIDLTDALRRSGVSQRHSVDVYGWRILAETLADQTRAPVARGAVLEGHADALALMGELHATSDGGAALFPLLSGPKVSALWVRLLAHPGGVKMTSMVDVPVAVDVQVRKVTEYLGVTDTGGLDLEDVRAAIQETWARDVAAHGAVGPDGIANTPGALDPALWFYGKWGCTFCQAAGQKRPISEICEGCRFPATGGARLGSRLDRW
jgi:hypothetical protein